MNWELFKICALLVVIAILIHKVVSLGKQYQTPRPIDEPGQGTVRQLSLITVALVGFVIFEGLCGLVCFIRRILPPISYYTRRWGKQKT